MRDEKNDPDAAPRASESPEETLVPALSALLSPMGQKAQDALISCLPDPVARAVNARLRLPEVVGEGEATPLAQALRAQAAEAWGGGSQKPEVRSQKSESGLELADVLALILRHARPGGLTRALLQLPDGLPAEVLYRIAAVNLGRVPHRIEREEAGVFFWRLREALGEARLKPAPELAARALRPVAAHTVRKILRDIYGIDPGATKAVQDLAYPFEDLTHLSDPELQMVLMGVENRDIALALQTTPALVQHRVEESMSARRRQAVEEEGALAGEVEEGASLRAKSRIVDRARLLYEQGQIHTYFGSIQDVEGAEQDLRKARQAVHEKHATWVAQWMRRSGGAGRQSIGVAVAAFVLIAGGAFFLNLLRSGGKGGGPAPEMRAERQGGAEGARQGEGRVDRGKGGIPLSQAPAVEKAVLGEGLRVLFSSGTTPGGEGVQPGRPGGGKGVRLRLGTARVVVLDPEAALETPLVRVAGPSGAAYRVGVGLDGTTRLTALRGTLSASLLGVKKGGTQIEAGLEALFSPGAPLRVSRAIPDAEDLAWLETNR